MDLLLVLSNLQGDKILLSFGAIPDHIAKITHLDTLHDTGTGARTLMRGRQQGPVSAIAKLVCMEQPVAQGSMACPTVGTMITWQIFSLGKRNVGIPQPALLIRVRHQAVEGHLRN